MENANIQKLLEQQNAVLSGLQTRVDFMADTLMVLESLMIVQATEPDGLQVFEAEELFRLLHDKQKTVRQKLDLIDAALKRRTHPPFPPPSPN
jgi:hypothetical protein